MHFFLVLTQRFKILPSIGSKVYITVYELQVHGRFILYPLPCWSSRNCLNWSHGHSVAYPQWRFRGGLGLSAYILSFEECDIWKVRLYFHLKFLFFKSEMKWAFRRGFYKLFIGNTAAQTSPCITHAEKQVLLFWIGANPYLVRSSQHV